MRFETMMPALTQLVCNIRRSNRFRYQQQQLSKGHSHPKQNKRNKNFSSADDFIFILKNQEPATKILKPFEDLNQATGMTINLEKTTVLSINTNNIRSNAPKITITGQYQKLKS